MNTQKAISQLQQFRKELYQLFKARPDALLDLVDALSSSPNARSVVELSLSPLFRREYSSVSDAIDNFFQASSPEKRDEERRAWEKELARLIGRFLPAPQQREFWLLGTDEVSISRPFALTLEDRALVHQPNPVGGNKPITIGHSYSVVAFLPEKGHDDPPWVVPLLVRRRARRKPSSWGRNNSRCCWRMIGSPSTVRCASMRLTALTVWQATWGGWGSIAIW